MQGTNRILKLLLFSFFCSLNPTGLCWVQAQDATKVENEKAWYYDSSQSAVEKKSIAQQKAEARAQQRMARLESHRWLGYSPSRPPSTAIPFTSSNRLAWKRAQRAPYRWYTGRSAPAYKTWPYYYQYH